MAAEAPQHSVEPLRVLSLVGLMGAGKSTVGALLAARWPEGEGRLVDLDAAIEAAAGKPVAAIFAEDGEGAFRALEARVLAETLAEAAATPGLTVLATGGGASCHAEGAERLLAAGPMIWLDAPAEVLALRAVGSDRPLLQGADRDEVARRLEAQRVDRSPHYGRASLRLPAELPAEVLVARILARFGPPPAVGHRGAMPAPLEVALPVEGAGHAYPIRFVAGLPGDALAETLAARWPSARRVLVVTDDQVATLYLPSLLKSLEAASHLQVLPPVVLEAGEGSKHLGAIGVIVDKALEGGLSRYDGLIAFGGGVVGDITGFAASMLHRGVPFIQVPTTLLAQVDSAVGGKTGVNHPRGKNLLGSFWQPDAVISSQSVLKTLAPRELRCGLAEAIKHGLIADPALMAWIADNRDALLALEPSAMGHLVARCCAIKRDVVVQDPRDLGQRAILNFGHTLGHSYEKLLGYGAISHGEAVALGMLQAARLSEALAARQGEGLDLYAPIVSLLDAFGFETDIDGGGLPDLDALLAGALNDKKADSAGQVRFIALKAIGQAVIVRLAWAEVRALLEEGRR